MRSTKFVPVHFKPAIVAANQAIAELDPDSRPDPLPEELRLYDPRHTAASLMICQGASVTLDTYGHLSGTHAAGDQQDTRALRAFPSTASSVR